MTLLNNKNLQWILILTMTVVVITPLGNDLYIASLPAIGQAFHTNNAQMVVSVFLFGLSISQLVYGPLLDRFGRKPVLLIGLAIYTAASAAIIVIHHFESLLLARFFQAVGACGSIAATLAIIRDSYPKDKTVIMIATIMGIVAICPTLAPMLGTYFQQQFGWHGSFVFLMALGAFYSIVVGLLFTESMQEKNEQAINVKHIISNYKTIMTHKCYLGYILTSCCSYSILFGYIAIAPYLIMHVLHVPLAWFGAIFCLSSIGIITMNFLVPTINKRFGLPSILSIGTTCMIIGSIILIIIIEMNKLSVPSLIFSMFIISMGVGLIRPTASAGAMNIFPPKIAGSAASMFGFFSFLGGSISSLLVTKFIHENSLMFAVMILALGIMGFIAARLCKIKHSTKAFDK